MEEYFTLEEIKNGRLLWEAYYDVVNGLSFCGEPLPTFENMKDSIRNNWIKTAIKYNFKIMYPCHI